MKNEPLFAVIAFLLVCSLAAPALARPVSRNVQLSQVAKVGKAELEAGSYRLLIDGSKVSVFKGQKMVAEMEGRWEQREAKYRYNSHLINRRGELEEIRFAGDDRVLILVPR